MTMTTTVHNVHMKNPAQCLECSSFRAFTTCGLQISLHCVPLTTRGFQKTQCNEEFKIVDPQHSHIIVVLIVFVNHPIIVVVIGCG